MLRIYTDGSCLGNPGRGGWAWATNEHNHDSGGELDTTNQRMELKAVLEALRYHARSLTIVTDSAYVVNCFRDRWYQGWGHGGFKTKSGEAVANWDLWSPILDLALRDQEVVFEKVKAHSGNRMNHFVDELARKAARAQ